MVPTEIEKIKKKVIKLLALSTSDNPEEADAALKKAKSFMETYNIRTIDVDEDSSTASVNHEVVQGSTKQKTSWEIQLAAGIAGCFDAQALVAPTEGGWQVTFIASTSELSIITDLYKRVRRAVSRMAREYCLNNKHAGHAQSLRSSYCMGMVVTVYKLLKTIYVDVPETRALVLVKTDAVQTLKKKMFPNTKKYQVNTTLRSREAFERGKADGHRVQLHKGVSGTNTQLLGEQHG